MSRALSMAALTLGLVVTLAVPADDRAELATPSFIAESGSPVLLDSTITHVTHQDSRAQAVAAQRAATLRASVDTEQLEEERWMLAHESRSAHSNRTTAHDSLAWMMVQR